jgi:hypothetical protein
MHVQLKIAFRADLWMRSSFIEYRTKASLL